MANLYTRKQIAELINKDAAYVGMYVHRGKLIEENKKIDISIPVNRAFIAKFTAKEVNKYYNQESEKIELSEKKTDKFKTNEDNEEKEDSKKQNINASNVDYVKKQFEIKKLTVETRLKNLELEKKKAKVLPLDFVIEWSALNIRGIFGETVNFGNSIIEQICNELEADIKLKLKFKKQFKDGFNEILIAGIKNQKPEAISQAKEYSLLTKW